MNIPHLSLLCHFSNFRKAFLFAVLTMFFCLNQAIGQNGPGGVGNKETYTIGGLPGDGLSMWVIADSATFDMSNGVTTLPNLADVDGLNMEGLASGVYPTYVPSAINGHAEISFADQVDALESKTILDADSFPTNTTTIFYVLRHDNNEQRASSYRTGTSGTAGSADASNRVGSHNPWNGEVFSDVGECGCAINNTGDDGRVVADYENEWVGQYGIWISRHTTSEKTLYRDEIIEGPVATPTSYAAYNQHASDNFYIGHSSNDNFQGDLAEMILYTSELNDAQVDVVRNYLAAKYDLTITNDYYLFQASHGIDVMGIGQSNGETHLEAKSADILTIKNATSIDTDGDFIFVGHDNADASAWTTDEQINGDSNLERIAREWRFDASGDPGTITISIDPSNLPASNTNFDFYTLWIDNDGDFTSGATQYPLTQNGAEFEASGIAITDGMFVTIAAYRPEINFTQTAFSGLETVTPVTFEVNIAYAIDVSLTVDYTVSGTSIENLPTPSPGTFTISAGNTSATLAQAITSADGFESDETIILTLSGTGGSPSAGVLGASDISTYTVNDDGAEAANTIQFDAPFSYDYMKAITIDHTIVSGSGDLTDFPIMIRIDGADLTEIEGNGIRGDGFDIRFTLNNSVQWLEHQIERYDATNEYIAWVKIPTLSATVDTEINMYYGNASASTNPSVNTVFTSNYEAVYHLEGVNDDSDNGNNGTLNGNAAITTDGYIGNGLTLDGNNDYLLNSDDTSLEMSPTDAFSISLWFKGTDNTAELVSRMDPGQNNRGYTFRILDSGGARLGLLIGESFSGTPVALRATTSLSSEVVDGDWHFLVGTYDGSTDLSGMNIYVDGESTTITTDGGLFNDNLSAGNNTNPNIPLSLGIRDGGGSNTNDTDGEIDEARVIRTELSADWIRTEYNTMTDAGVLITATASVATSGFQIAESTDMLNLTVALTSVDANDVSIDYAVTSGTASSGTDYALAAGTATVTAGNLSTVITVDLTDDAVDEVDETFIVSLSNPTSVSNVSLGSNNEIEITLLDDDNGPTITVSDTLLYVNEGSTNNEWSVGLSAASGQVITVDYAITAISATSGADYIHNSGTLTIPADSTSASVNFNIVDDESIETGETFAIKLSNPINALLDVVYDSITVTINDNDNFGIDGPGGVGDADGTGTLVMWMIADSATVSGSDVVSWENEVGISELDLSPVPANDSPTLVTNAKNGHSEISFADVNDALATSQRLSTAYFPYNEATTFMVTRHDNSTQEANAFATSENRGEGPTGSSRFRANLPWAGQIYYTQGGCCNNVERLQYPYNNDWTGNYLISTYVSSEANGKIARDNGTLSQQRNGVSPIIDHSSLHFNLGYTGNDNYQGDVLEFIMYTSPLNDAQIIITENYLAAKYDLTLDQNNYYSFKTTHSTEVVGIGREDASNFHNAAQSNLLTISNASDLDDGEYVLVGHDNLDISAWTTTDVPSDLSNIQRVEREFRVDVTGSPGTISIAIDSDKLPTLPADYTEYVLLTDADGLFSAGATTYSMTLVNGEYIANNVSVSQGTYFTLATHRRTIEFVGASIQDFENVNNTISLSLSLASGVDISIPYTITGTATNGADYTIAASGSFTITAGNTVEIIDLGILNEAEEESDETIIVTLGTAPSGTILGTDVVFTYTINDDDIIRSINFDHFKYSKDVTINGAEVTGTHTDFPVMISFTDNDLRTLGNAGFVENVNGYDITFYDSLNATWLDHQLEYYDAATGEAVLWVRIPTLSAGTDVELTMFYGNSGITFDQSSTDTWKSSYQGIWHMGSDNYDDGTANGINGVDQGADDATGIIGRGAYFDGLSTVKVSDVGNLSFGVSDSYTISAWYKGTDAAKTIAGLVDDNSSSGQGYDLYISSSNYLIGWQGDDSGAKNYIRGSAGGNINDDAWKYVVVTYDGTNGIAYTNGTSAMGFEDGGTLSGTLSPNVSFTIGSRSNGAALARAIIGTIDEVRVLNEVLSPEWIATEYANQNTPGTFLTIDPTQNTNESLTLAEDIDEVTVTVRVDPIDDSQSTTVNFVDAGSGTAVISEDFMLTPGTVTIPAGEQLGTFTFNVVNDLTDESDETIILNINTPSSNTKLGTVNEQTYTVTDDDDLPTIGFVDTLSVVNEGSSLVFIPLQLSLESGNDVSVNYAVTGGDAIAGTDFIALSGTVTVPAGSLTTTISFQPIDDAIIESPETIEITITVPTNGTLKTKFDVHTVTMADNDDLGYEGPGGVGDVENALGENLLKLWLIADSVETSGSSVTSWNNIIKNVSIDYDMVPVGTAPDVIDAAVNGHKEISFNNVSDALVSEGALSAASFPGNEMSFFIVTETDNLNQDSYTYATDDSENGAVDANSISASIPNDLADIEFDFDGDNYTTDYLPGWAGEHSIFTHIVSSDTFLVYRNNGVLVNREEASPTPSFTGHTAYNFYLGKNGDTDNFQGDIAEVIMFSRDVNVAQSNLINNYLAAKYNLSITNDYYNFEVSHGVEVAGIGQVDANNQHVAARAGIVTISNASDLDDGEYVLFGHDNGDISSWVTSEVPATGISRTAREWRFDNTGSPGDISIAISSGLLPALPTGNEDYVIMQDADGDFSSGATVINTVFVDGQYKASNLSIASGDYVTFGIATRTISFDPIASNGSETLAANAAVTLSLESSTDITVDYDITGGTATGTSTDYSLASTGQVTFIAGQTSVNLGMGIINDSELESDETIEITLSNPPAGVTLTNPVFTYTIQDDDNDRKIQFDATSLTVAEDVGTVTLTIELEDPLFVDPTNDTKAYISVTGGSAEASPAPDFSFVADTVIIPATQTSVTFDLDITDDVLSEIDETLEISLSSPKNANLGTNSVFTYTITDDDDDVTVAFQNSTTTIDEGGSIAKLVVELSTTSGQDIEVSYAAAAGTATGMGIDYALSNGILTIPAGDQLGTINVALTDDGLEESAETFTVTISIGSGATLGSPSVHTVTISDNDAEFGYHGPGGVGDRESNMLWLDATAINGKGFTNLSDASNVAVWKDRSGNGYDFTAIGAQPVFDEDALNLKNTVVISSSSQGLQSPNDFSNALSNYSFISVMSQSGGQYLVEDNTAATLEFKLNQGSDALYSLNSTDYLANPSTGIDITTWIFNSDNSPTSAEIFRNGSALSSDDSFEVMPLSSNFALASRGFHETQTATDFEGNISEFIIYKNVINAAQRVIIENYLANKYDLTIPNDYYDYEGTYGFDIVGIGQTSDEFHLQSMSDSLMMIGGASDLDNNEYVFAGHDNGDDLSWTTSEAPSDGSNVRRLAREWRVGLEGSPGTIIIKMDTIQLPEPPTGYDQYVIWTDDDGDFRSGAVSYQVEYSEVFGYHVTDEVTISEGTFITLGVAQPVVQFSLASSDGNEDDTNPTIEVSLNFSVGSDVTINYAATGGTATGTNIDYLLTSGTLTIAEGQTSANINLGVIDDSSEEGDETIIVTLATPSSNVSLGGTSQHTYTIHDNDADRDVSFSLTTGAGNEVDESTHSVTLTLSSSDPIDPTTVDLEIVSIASDAADVTDDFTLSTTTVTFPPNSMSETFDIVLVDDDIYEGTEQITIQLTNPVNADLGTDDSYVFTITDNDTQPVADFVEASSFVNESGGIASMEVTLDGISVNDISVNYTVTGIASSGDDYTLADGSLLILAGEISENIQAIIIDDLVTEAAETVTVTLTGATNATVSGTTVHVLTILDNDQDGSTGPGGVGDASNNLLWLRGDNFSAGTWTDISGNSNDFSGGIAPSAGTSINSNGTVGFTGSEYLSTSSLSSNAGDYDFFFALNSSATADQVLFGSDDADPNDISLGYHHASGLFFDQNGWTGSELIATGTNIIQYNLESGSNLAEQSINGTVGTSVTYTATSIGGTKSIGALSGGTDIFTGDIGEVIMYDNSLNDAQRIIVNNYLSARYDVAITNDNYAYNGSSATDYNYNLIGIGQEDSDNIHVAATSEDFLTISNPDDLGDMEYLMVANNGGDMMAWTFTGAPANGSARRIEREWRVDKTNDLGAISFQIDTTYLPAPPISGLTWALIVTSDGDFTDIDATYPLTFVSGDIVGVDGLDFTDGDYFTLALVEYQSTGASTDFNNPLAWTTGVVPTAGTNAKIVDGHSLEMSADAVVGSITLEGTGALDINGFTLEFSEDCIVLNGSGSVDISTAGSTIGYANPNVVDQCVTGMIYNNLYTNGPSGSTKYLTGNIEVQGNVNLQSAAGTGAIFDVRDLGTTDDYNIDIEGNWVSEITFNARTGTVTFDGTLDQLINTSGGETFNDLLINKASGQVALSSDVTMIGDLTLTAGNIELGISDLNIDDSGAIISGSATSYIIADNVGLLRHSIPSVNTYDFPIGDSDEYSPLTFTLNSGSLTPNVSKVTVNVKDNTHPNISGSNYLSRYWSLNNEGVSSPNYTISYTYQNSDINGDESVLKARKFSASGNEIGGTVNIGTNVLSNTYTSFSDHTGESEPGVLPVTLISFTADAIKSGVQLKWQTGTEIDNSYFEVQRSKDGYVFDAVGSVEGNGNSSELIDYSFIDDNAPFGINYYRLRQVDFDGDFEYSPIIFVNYEGFITGMDMVVYPNPAHADDINLYFETGNLTSKVHIQIVDMLGVEQYAVSLEMITFKETFTLNAGDLTTGLYYIIVKQGKNIRSERLFIE